MLIYFIRHTRTVLSSGTCYGQYDAPLADSFEREADEVKSKINIKVEKVFSSPLRRCTLLAERVFESHIVTDERIKELDFGQWELKKWDEIDREHFLEWSNNYFHTKAGRSGESCEQLYNRVKDFYSELILSGISSAAIITHAGVIRCFFSLMLNMKMEDTFKLDLSYGCISKARIDGEYMKFEYINK